MATLHPLQKAAIFNVLVEMVCDNEYVDQHMASKPLDGAMPEVESFLEEYDGEEFSLSLEGGEFRRILDAHGVQVRSERPKAHRLIVTPGTRVVHEVAVGQDTSSELIWNVEGIMPDEQIERIVAYYGSVLDTEELFDQDQVAECREGFLDILRRHIKVQTVPFELRLDRSPMPTLLMLSGIGQFIGPVPSALKPTNKIQIMVMMVVPGESICLRRSSDTSRSPRLDNIWINQTLLSRVLAGHPPPSP